MSRPLSCQSLDLVLALADDDRHVGRLHQLDPAGQPGPFQLGKAVVLGAQLGQVLGPLFSHQVVHAHGGCLVDADVHRLAGEPPAHEVPDQVLRDGAQAFGPRDERILPPEPTYQRPFGVLVEFGLLQQLGQFVGEVLVDELSSGMRFS